MKKRFILYGLIGTFLALLINLLVMNRYGITWDYHHVFFGGLYHLRLPMKPEMEDNLPFVEPDPRNMWITPFGLIMTATPVLSYHWFYDQWKLLPFDEAYLLPTVIIGTFGAFVLFLFILEAESILPATLAALLLLLYPRYSSELHINFKDAPQAVIFALNIYLFWRLVRYRKIKNLILASLAFAIAFNIKVNAAFILPITGLFTLFQFILEIPFAKSSRTQIHSKNKALSILSFPIRALISWLTDITKTFLLKRNLPVTSYFFLAPMSAFLLWGFFWNDPAGQFTYLVQFFQDNTLNIEVLFDGSWYCPAINVPWWYPLGYLGIVTPLPVLVFFLIGLVISFWKIIKKNSFYLLLILWLILPLSRYLSPKIGVIDGIRHYEEVIFPLVAIAALSLSSFIRYLDRILITQGNIFPKNMKHIKKRAIIFGIPAALLFSHLVWNIIRLHPYQIAYFNELVGGTKGAMGKYDLDYWGASQKEAVQWINKNARENARIHIVMSGDTAAKYLRPDLRKTVNHFGYDQSDYVVVLNRQSFFYRYFFVWEYFLRRKPIHIIEADGVSMTWIFDNSLGQFERQIEWWSGEDPCIRKYWESSK